MTSSLVGSEMCIRDRMTVHQVKKPPLLMEKKTEPSTEVNRWAIQHKPVSYTHLTLPTICSV
eukprot:7874039-Prorocentrum_lima.AAC.1